ncbi:DUF5916 domain-containing protein [Pedobacter lithocola]|uniref:DUF5916 domain-containing protein n=1 Tax=Pedobacter lithocola TaxID=1908239 RepID=A0ABV8PHE1_9SPHI
MQKKTCKFFFLVATLSASLCLHSFAQEVDRTGNFPPPVQQVKLQALRTNTPITIDGKIDEQAWKMAIPVNGFVQVDPNQGKPTNYSTIVKILFDEKYLYIAAYCSDSIGKNGIRVQDLRRDFGFFDNDLFGVAIDPFNGKRNAMVFQTNPYGAQRDLQSFDDNIFDRDWDALWNTRSQINDDGWSCEMAIPWKTLRYPDAKDGKSIWGINFVRIARRTNETSAFPGYPRSTDSYRMTYTALLEGIEPPKPSTNIQVNPYTVATYTDHPDGGKKLQSKFGGEFKWNPNVHSTVDVTINTDFAQADADRQVNNLTRFSVLFPERRQFFLENAGLFDAGSVGNFKPFFSRSIGLDQNGDLIPIDAGLRYTDKNTSYSLGALYVHQRNDNNSLASNIAVARLIKNYSKANNIGLLLTGNQQQADNGTSNGSASITGFNRISDKLSLDYTFSGTKTKGITPADGVAATAKLSYNSNGMGLLYSTTFISNNYNPALGFVARNNYINNYLDVYLLRRKVSWLPKFIRSWEPGVSLDSYQNPANLNLQEALIKVYPIFLVFNDGGKLIASAHFNLQRLDQEFNPLGLTIPKGSYNYTQANLEYYSDRSSKFSYGIYLNHGGYYDGNISSFTGNVRYAPLAQLAFSIDYEYNKLKNIGIDKNDLTTQLVVPNVRMALNPRLQFNLFYQYNTATASSRWNSRFSWEYRPQSFIYLVYNQLGQTGLHQQQTIAKISYLKQF